MSPDLPALRAAYASDPAFAAVFTALERGRNVRRASVQRVAHGGRDQRLELAPEAEVRRVFEQLAVWGFGEFQHRGSARRAQFVWAIRPRAAIAAAQGRLAELAPAHSFPVPRGSAPPPVPASAGPPPLPTTWERHRLPLRPGREVELVFPPDLAADEARWIGDYLERLARQAALRAKEKPAD